jgi:hypothetical protein
MLCADHGVSADLVDSFGNAPVKAVDKSSPGRGTAIHPQLVQGPGSPLSAGLPAKYIE